MLLAPSHRGHRMYCRALRRPLRGGQPTLAAISAATSWASTPSSGNRERGRWSRFPRCRRSRTAAGRRAWTPRRRRGGALPNESFRCFRPASPVVGLVSPRSSTPGSSGRTWRWNSPCRNWNGCHSEGCRFLQEGRDCWSHRPDTARPSRPGFPSVPPLRNDAVAFIGILAESESESELVPESAPNSVPHAVNTAPAAPSPKKRNARRRLNRAPISNPSP